MITCWSRGFWGSETYKYFADMKKTHSFVSLRSLFTFKLAVESAKNHVFCFAAWNQKSENSSSLEHETFLFPTRLRCTKRWQKLAEASWIESLRSASAEHLKFVNLQSDLESDSLSHVDTRMTLQHEIVRNLIQMTAPVQWPFNSASKLRRRMQNCARRMAFWVAN